MKLLLFGANGQVGSEVVKQARVAGFDLIACTRTEVDITQEQSVADIITSQQPSIVINAAAYTAVDHAETEKDQAFAVNASAPGFIAAACGRRQIPILHISTDYVFDGMQQHPYTEQDATGPINCYGQSKLEGEQAVRDSHSRHIILRTSWVFGETGNNFVKTIIRLAREREQLSVVDDQHGCPTPAAAIASALLKISNAISANDDILWGTYHFCGLPETTWYGFAEKIISIAQVRMTLNLRQLIPITTQEFPTPAARPRQTVMQCDKIREHFGVTQPDWEIALHHLVDRLIEGDVFQ